MCSALFSSRENAEELIRKYSLSGVLTRMPLDKSIYDWAVECDFFTPRREEQKTNTFIQKFTSAYLEHSHYKNGSRSDDE